MPQTQFTVIVPLVGPVNLFEDTLASVLRSRPERCQVIAVHASAYDDPHGLAGEVEFHRIHSAEDQQVERLVDSWNIALAHARGEFVAWFYPGIEVAEGWEWELSDEFSDADIGCLILPIFGVHSTSRPKQKRKAVFGALCDRFGNLELLTDEPTMQRAIMAEQIVPTALTAVYRNRALGWLDLLDSSLSTSQLGAEIGLSLNAIGYRTAISESCFVTTDCAETLISQIDVRDGLSAERRISRYFSSQPISRGRRIVREILGGVFDPHRIANAWQRWQARSFDRGDQQYAAQLQLSRERRLKFESESQPAQKRAA